MGGRTVTIGVLVAVSTLGCIAVGVLVAVVVCVTAGEAVGAAVDALVVVGVIVGRVWEFGRYSTTVRSRVRPTVGEKVKVSGQGQHQGQT